MVWRGHQNAAWPVDSSLTRSLRTAGHKLGEDELIAVERFQIAASECWGIWPTLGEMNFYAQMQHDGVPTRLIGVSLDPEVAAWFAVEESEELDSVDGHLISWGRSAAPKRNQTPEPPQWIPAAGGDAFWHMWPDQETRRAKEWGTGRAMPS
ncbi:FRG domain-containing protein [Pseudoclavibacter terrae]|uniref:FRG domain-containing protein n=1 Tax=Pseudoclavibacter terrae TaxID=1530195 RepID=UPI00142EED4E|nr:FRG domain-containing protein [Pseudoclavibacter terrae]